MSLCKVCIQTVLLTSLVLVLSETLITIFYLRAMREPHLVSREPKMNFCDPKTTRPIRVSHLFNVVTNLPFTT